MLRALELFSGIGAFANAAGRHENISVVAAYDQSPEANATYALNYGRLPCNKNLDSITASELVPADLWWMSPPCQPYTVRGSGKDLDDPRAKSLLNLLELIKEHKPRFVIVENVLGFAESKAESLLLKTLAEIGLATSVLDLCPTMFGIPMRRPRRFIAANASGNFASLCPPPASTRSLSDFLTDGDQPLLRLPDHQLSRYERSLNILEGGADDYAICFTRGYGRSMKAAGSYIRLPDGGARRFSPREMLDMFGFSEDFMFPAELPLSTQWKLIGNSVSTHCLNHVLTSTVVLMR